MCLLILIIPLRFGDILMISDGECNVPSMKSQSMNTSCHGNTVVIYLWSNRSFCVGMQPYWRACKSLTNLIILVVLHIVSRYAFNFCIHNNLDYHL